MRRLVGASLMVCAACSTVIGLDDKTLAPTDAGPNASDSGSADTDRADAPPLRIGMPTVLQGVSEQLGTQMKRGVEAWFKEVNDRRDAKHTRPLVLVAVNDNYEPASATVAIKQLLDIQGDMKPNDCASSLTPPDCVLQDRDNLGPNRVLSILGQVGTPTMVVTAPVCIRNRVIYFAPFTGAQRFLRDSNTTADVIFNYRAGYYEEAAAFVDYFFRTASPPVSDHTHVLGFTQNDTYGDAVYNGFRIAYQTKIAPIADTAIKRINYTRNDLTSVNLSITDATDYMQSIVNAEKAAPNNQRISFGIFLVPTYAPAAKFVKGIRDWVNADADRNRLLNVEFMSVSFVGGDALVNELKSLGTYNELGTGTQKYYGDAVWVTQVVPFYGASLPGVVKYRKDLAAFDTGAPSWGSLEGYLGARLFTEGLARSSAFDTDSMIKAYESIKDFDLGIGPKLAFDSALPEGHQGSHAVWLSKIHFNNATPAGSFDVPWLWVGPVKKDFQIVAP